MLRKIREENNLTQSEMAEKIGCSCSNYVKLENDFVKPNFDFMQRLKTAFPEVDMNGFFRKKKPAQADT